MESGGMFDGANTVVLYEELALQDVLPVSWRTLARGSWTPRPPRPTASATCGCCRRAMPWTSSARSEAADERLTARRRPHAPGAQGQSAARAGRPAPEHQPPAAAGGSGALQFARGHLAQHRHALTGSRRAGNRGDLSARRAGRAAASCPVVSPASCPTATSRRVLRRSARQWLICWKSWPFGATGAWWPAPASRRAEPNRPPAHGAVTDVTTRACCVMSP